MGVGQLAPFSFMARLSDETELYEVSTVDGKTVIRTKIVDSDINANVDFKGDESELNSTTPPLDLHETFAIGLPGVGGHVVGGTFTNPLRIDPTGTTTQPVISATADGKLAQIFLELLKANDLQQATLSEIRKTNIYLEHMTDLGILGDDFIE